MKFTADGIVTNQIVHNGKPTPEKVGVVTSWFKLFISSLAVIAIIGNAYSTFSQVAKNEKGVKDLSLEVQKIKVEQSADSMYTQRMLEEIIKTINPSGADKTIEKLKKEREDTRKELERKFLNAKTTKSG